MSEKSHKAPLGEGWDPVQTLATILYESRDWHADLQRRFEFHPVVAEAITLAPCKCWHTVVLQWPHRSEKDSKMLAYTRDEAKGHADQQTRTAVGKYIKAHFPSMKDDVIRDLVYKHNAEGCHIWNTPEQIVRAVQEGPDSCMQWTGSKEHRLHNWGGHHPYECYAPKFGWAVAVRLDENENIVARALVYEHGGDKCFVRTYGYDGSDHELQSWLIAQGYEFNAGWPNSKLARIEYDGNVLFPYIDGNNDTVDVCSSHLHLYASGDYGCSNQDGTSDYESGSPCPDCGDNTDDDDRCYVGRHDEEWVCSDCQDRHYTCVEGRNGHEYYVHEDNAVSIGGRYYDENYLPSDVVYLEDGTPCFKDDAVHCEESDEWYHCNDSNIITLECGDPCHRDYAWQCEATGDWYADSDVKPVEIDGLTYHPDNVPEEDNEEAEGRPPLGGWDRPEGTIPNEAQLPLTVQEGNVPHKWQHILDALAAGVPCEWSFNGKDWFSADPKENCCDDAEYRITAIQALTREEMQEVLNKGGELQQIYQGVWVDWNSHQGVPYEGHTGTFRIKPGSIVTSATEEIAA